jgi:hypothetical protein
LVGTDWATAGSDWKMTKTHFSHFSDFITALFVPSNRGIASHGGATAEAPATVAVFILLNSAFNLFIMASFGQ